MEAVRIKAKNVMDKFQDWSKVLIEPATLNDARLYSLESRIHEEEELRIREFDFIKDLTKKLIYSLEQSSAGTVDKGLLNDPSNFKGSPVSNARRTQVSMKETPLLPNLLNN